jgi:hypothetical protein
MRTPEPAEICCSLRLARLTRRLVGCRSIPERISALIRQADHACATMARRGVPFCTHQTFVSRLLGQPRLPFRLLALAIKVKGKMAWC